MRESSAFSLLETVLALGLVSTVLVAAMGLIPLGVRTAHDAEQGAAQARIIHHIRHRCGKVIPEGAFHFSGNGSPVPAGSRDAVYTVTLQSGTGISLPGNPGRPLRSVLIRMRDLTPAWRLTQTLLLPP